MVQLLMTVIPVQLMHIGLMVHVSVKRTGLGTIARTTADPATNAATSVSDLRVKNA